MQTCYWVFRKKDLYLITTQKLTFMKSGGFHTDFMKSGRFQVKSSRFNMDFMKSVRFQVKSGGFHRISWNLPDFTHEIRQDFERPIARNGKPYVYVLFWDKCISLTSGASHVSALFPPVLFPRYFHHLSQVKLAFWWKNQKW